jgi:glycolate oxidase iron-sulfur subunit
MSKENEKRDLTVDLLLCNRCGACRAVCPIHEAVGGEWAAARGKVELAEAFFRGEDVGETDVQRIYDLCLHCLACEANCPSGMRADEVIMAVRAELARRGRIPRLKRFALKLLEGTDNLLFRLMRRLGLARKAPLHGVGGKGPLSFLYPLIGWPRERFVPLPAAKPFLGNRPEFFAAADFDRADLDTAPARRKAAARGLDPDLAADLVQRFARARARNREQRRSVYFFVGHTVNHFFPEEAEAVVFLLNMLGLDVHAPADQLCCGAPLFYAGDIEGTRRAADRLLRRFGERGFDLIVTSCASGGRMLKYEFPRLFDITADGFFRVEWDSDAEVFRRGAGGAPAGYAEAAELYRRFVEGRTLDINELLAAELGLEEPADPLAEIFGRSGAEEAVAEALESIAPAAARDPAPKAPPDDGRPTVTYHHPCHLGRGQDVVWQPVKLLEALPGWRYVPMKDADRCCGGGGTFTFTHPEESESIARIKTDAVEESEAAVVATACPLCRIQLMDMLRRRFEIDARRQGRPPRQIPVLSTVELLAGDMARILR